MFTSRLEQLDRRKAALDREVRSLKETSTRRVAPHIIEMERSSHILLVEDSHVDARLIAEALRSLEYPHFLTRAATGDEALALLEDCERFSRRNPDLILLDLNMPGRDGFELLALLKHASRYRRIPVVVLSESERAEDVERAHDLHANAFVRKGRSLKELAESLEVVCRMWLRIAARASADY